MTRRKRGQRVSGLLKEAARIERDEIEISDEEAEGRWVFLRPAAAREPSQVYSIRLPVTAIERLRVLAAFKGDPPTQLIRTWVLDRIDSELSAKADEGSIEFAREGTVPYVVSGGRAAAKKRAKPARTAVTRPKASAKKLPKKKASAKKESGAKRSS